MSQFVAAPLDQQLPQSLVSIHNYSELFLDGGAELGCRWLQQFGEQQPHVAQTQTVNQASAASQTASSVMMEIYFQHT